MEHGTHLVFVVSNRLVAAAAAVFQARKGKDEWEGNYGRKEGKRLAAATSNIFLQRKDWLQKKIRFFLQSR
jgi:hypothetical protein